MILPESAFKIGAAAIGAAAIAAVLLLPTELRACQREREFFNHQLPKRQATPVPELTADEQLIISSFDNNSISDWSNYYTHGDHLAGRNRSQAQWTASRWAEAGFETRLDSYHVFLNYPVSKSIVVIWPNGTTYTPSLEEAILEEDDVTGWTNRIPTFHGYSFSGSASAEYVYVGRGQQVDFERLLALGVDLKGKIALSRYGGPFRGLKVKNAQEHGMIGTIIFTDPGEDGNITVAKGVTAYPNGPARNPTSVQRGSVQFLSTYPGDPTTPGYPSREDSPRADKNLVTPQIPSIPMSYEDIKPILAALDGFGTPGAEVNRNMWVGALNATYATGPAPGVTISMENQMEDACTDIWNAVGIINGTNVDETVIIGNHRDAWLVGGAADPNSGTAIIVELGRVFGKLLAQGWKPKRNVVLCSWDAEEYGLVGSTEWVEEYIPWIKDTVVSYLNIDIGASGPHPSITGSPELHAVATELMKKVVWPAMGGVETMYDVWLHDTMGQIGILGSGSDYTAFVHRGIAAVGRLPLDRIRVQHVLTRQTDQHLVSLRPSNYADHMSSYYNIIHSLIAKSSQDLDTSNLDFAIKIFRSQALEAEALAQQALATGDSALLNVVNKKYRDFQRGFASQGGLPGRPFYQHMIFAPGIDTGYAPVTFPGITEAVEAGNFMLAEDYLQKTIRAIAAAGNVLQT
ncbi:hypothetical protein DOTSEDRAFT_64147 [Dothistroma septosporum NZE10]|uniref:Uncharacterized protein n=1 Tax=Dothistroma septosporum (strain NZE10 / CBS 128990) TaxID=675120 RepID=N1PI69_DOTSN|nr:hypothetical protein DOTSEDRAFT_64147 [Dothistroma septosporum NZE10]